MSIGTEITKLYDEAVSAVEKVVEEVEGFFEGAEKDVVNEYDKLTGSGETSAPAVTAAPVTEAAPAVTAAPVTEAAPAVTAAPVAEVATATAVVTPAVTAA